MFMDEWADFLRDDSDNPEDNAARKEERELFDAAVKAFCEVFWLLKAMQRVLIGVLYPEIQHVDSEMRRGFLTALHELSLDDLAKKIEQGWTLRRHNLTDPKYREAMGLPSSEKPIDDHWLERQQGLAVRELIRSALLHPDIIRWLEYLGDFDEP
jgi:hypothetical protein